MGSCETSITELQASVFAVAVQSAILATPAAMEALRGLTSGLCS
jgi:hypothetical protein